MTELDSGMVEFDLDSIMQDNDIRAPRIVIYGPQGVGKTSLAASFPEPIFMQLEDGLSDLKARSFTPGKTMKTMSQVIGAIDFLVNKEHPFRTLVVDTIDWLEPIIWQQTATDNGWASIEEAGYGKGYNAASDHWRMFLDGMATIRDERDMAIVLLAHNKIEKFLSPVSEPYDRYMIKLHKTASALVQENVDDVFFLNYRDSVVKTDLGFKKEAARGVGSSDRYLFTQRRAAWDAKNRHQMPEEIRLPNDPMKGWEAIASLIPYYNQAKEAV